MFQLYKHLYWFCKNILQNLHSVYVLELFELFEFIYFLTADEDILHFIDRYENSEFDIMFHELNLPFSLDEKKKA